MIKIGDKVSVWRNAEIVKGEVAGIEKTEYGDCYLVQSSETTNHTSCDEFFSTMEDRIQKEVGE